MEMIKGILKMDVVKVREIMKPRVDLVAIEEDSNLKELTKLISDSGYSKIPVIGDSIDEVKGIVYAKDTLKMHLNSDKSLTISEVMRPAIFVPESQNLEQLLSEFQDKRTRIAIVIDEHGGISGLVTVTDLIEEIEGFIEKNCDMEDAENSIDDTSPSLEMPYSGDMEPPQPGNVTSIEKAAEVNGGKSTRENNVEKRKGNEKGANRDRTERRKER